MADKVYKFPKKLGTCADRYYKLRQERLEAQKKADAIKAEELALKDYIINTLPKSEASGVAGKVARVTVVTKEVPQAEDWPAIHKYISRTKSFDLLQRRLNNKAVQERWEAGKEIKGVGHFTVVDVSVNKV